MAVTPADLQAFPQFTSLPDVLIQGWIDRAPQHIDQALFGDQADLATTYWTAHVLTATTGGAAAAGGPVASTTVGPVSTSYAVGAAAPTFADWSSSSWGRMLLQLATVRANSASLVL